MTMASLDRYITPETQAIGTYLKGLRDSLDISKNKVSKETGITRGTVGNVENGYCMAFNTVSVLLRYYGSNWPALARILEKAGGEKSSECEK